MGKGAAEAASTIPPGFVADVIKKLFGKKEPPPAPLLPGKLTIFPQFIGSPNDFSDKAFIPFVVCLYSLTDVNKIIKATPHAPDTIGALYKQYVLTDAPLKNLDALEKKITEVMDQQTIGKKEPQTTLFNDLPQIHDLFATVGEDQSIQLPGKTIFIKSPSQLITYIQDPKDTYSVLAEDLSGNRIAAMIQGEVSASDNLTALFLSYAFQGHASHKITKFSRYFILHLSTRRPTSYLAAKFQQKIDLTPYCKPPYAAGTYILRGIAIDNAAYVNYGGNWYLVSFTQKASHFSQETIPLTHQEMDTLATKGAPFGSRDYYLFYEKEADAKAEATQVPEHSVEHLESLASALKELAAH
jgi:hypothetical protein